MVYLVGIWSRNKNMEQSVIQTLHKTRWWSVSSAPPPPPAHSHLIVFFSLLHRLYHTSFFVGFKFPGYQLLSLINRQRRSVLVFVLIVFLRNCSPHPYLEKKIFHGTTLVFTTVLPERSKVTSIKRRLLSLTLSMKLSMKYPCFLTICSSVKSFKDLTNI